ncbi:GerAB/ArcD/ProY family transporter [Neobacillus rhizophilus]|uniref:Endospore germination permease n=1 Tax=Neobacillus rhizophilus TaxID=2833579 RepID=A0A942U826_9BACI|nr:endospore germination permease [Neobacillus rhizophilus]MBS4214343.1 endospore germination permease [Neobacillus rhizophilus]
MDTRHITTTQAAAILISTIIGVGVLPLPLFAVQAGGTGAPLVTFLGMVLGAIGLFILTFLGIRHPQKTIITYSEDIIGKWFGRFCSLFVILFFFILTGLAAREFGEVVVAGVLQETPLEVTVIVMLLLACISCRNNINVFSYIHSFYLPMILAPVLIVVALSLKNANLLYLRPIIGTNLPHMFLGTLTISALFQGSFIVTMIIPSMKNPKKAIKASLWGISISGGLYLLLVIATVSVFGTEEMKQIFWPTLELARTTAVPGNVLQRLDVIFLAVWVTAVFTTLFSSYYFTIHSIKQLLNLPDQRMLSCFIFPFIFISAMLPQNLLQMYEFIKFVGRVGLLITIVYPGLLLTIDFFKNRGLKGSASQQT